MKFQKSCLWNSELSKSLFLIFQPYDEEYLKSKDIKHMSFHAHVRKLTAGHGKSTTLTKPLENTK